MFGAALLHGDGRMVMCVGIVCSVAERSARETRSTESGSNLADVSSARLGAAGARVRNVVVLGHQGNDSTYLWLLNKCDAARSATGQGLQRLVVAEGDDGIDASGA